MTRNRATAVIACFALSLFGCSSGSPKHTTSPATTTSRPTPTTSTTTPPPVRASRANLDFREVSAQYPWAAAAKSGGSGAFPGCQKLIDESPRDTPTAGELVVPDRRSESCFVVGPVLVSGRSVDRASLVYDSSSSQWAVNVHFANDDFLHKVAGPMVGKQVAVIVDAVVQSAPMINPGITGRDVEITGGFTQNEARNLAASILGVSPADVHVDSTDAPD